MTELNLVKVMQAADAAAKWHVHQRRKGPGQEPYTNHLLEVAALVATATDGQDSEVVVAALLHDAIEDQEVPAELIVRNWGEGVAALVLELTDDKTLPKEERKSLQMENASKKSQRARIIKLADKTSNLRSIAIAAPGDWSVRRKIEYIEWASTVVSKMGKVNPWLEGQFQLARKAALNSIGMGEGTF